MSLPAGPAEHNEGTLNPHRAYCGYESQVKSLCMLSEVLPCEPEHLCIWLKHDSGRGVQRASAQAQMLTGSTQVRGCRINHE